MTSEELKAELKKQKEREFYSNAVLEYIRIKSIIAESGAISPAEAEAIAMKVCEINGTFGWL